MHISASFPAAEVKVLRTEIWKVTFVAECMKVRRFCFEGGLCCGGEGWGVCCVAFCITDRLVFFFFKFFFSWYSSLRSSASLVRPCLPTSKTSAQQHQLSSNFRTLFQKRSFCPLFPCSTSSFAPVTSVSLSRFPTYLTL